MPTFNTTTGTDSAEPDLEQYRDETSQYGCDVSDPIASIIERAAEVGLDSEFLSYQEVRRSVLRAANLAGEVSPYYRGGRLLVGSREWYELEEEVLDDLGLGHDEHGNLNGERD